MMRWLWHALFDTPVPVQGGVKSWSTWVFLECRYCDRFVTLDDDGRAVHIEPEDPV